MPRLTGQMLRRPIRLEGTAAKPLSAADTRVADVLARLGVPFLDDDFAFPEVGEAAEEPYFEEYQEKGGGSEEGKEKEEVDNVVKEGAGAAEVHTRGAASTDGVSQERCAAGLALELVGAVAVELGRCDVQGEQRRTT